MEARRLGEVSELVEQISQELQTRRNPEYMLWRLVDCAGIVSELADSNAIGQTTRPTGRGYYIGKVSIPQKPQFTKRR